MLRAIYSFFKSVRVAIVLILLLIVLSLLSTLVPQGREQAFYQATYSAVVYRLIVALDFGRFFSSVIFLSLAALFALNLGVCAVDRFLRRARSKAQPQYGPDIVHIGLLLLLAGALVTGLARQERDFTMAQGDAVSITEDYSIKLLSFQFLKYENGSPRSWISTVDVFRGGTLVATAFPIRVNHPLRLKGVAVYQTNYANEGSIVLSDAQGGQATARVGQGFQDGQSFWYFADIVDEGGFPVALFQEYRGTELVSMRKLARSETLGPYTLVSLQTREVTGLRAVSDPGFVIVILALAVIAAGLALTFIQKGREKQI